MQAKEKSYENQLNQPIIVTFWTVVPKKMYYCNRCAAMVFEPLILGTVLTFDFTIVNYIGKIFRRSIFPSSVIEER